MRGEKYTLLSKPSQLICMNYKVNNHRIWMYQDDPEDFAFGGNKVHFYEYLMNEILEEQPDVIITSGAMYSNHLRVTAMLAQQLGFECELMILEDELPKVLPGSLNLALQYGATANCIGKFAALLKIQDRVNVLEQSGKKVFVVPNGGRTASAVNAYAEVVENVFADLSKKNVVPSKIYLPCASGTTQSGVLCGLMKQLNENVEVVSFAVANKPEKAVREINKLLALGKVYLPENKEIPPIIVKDCGKNKYGQPDEELLQLREQVYKVDGILLDPVYNINAFWGMVKELMENPGESDVIYINTGGYRELI